MEDIGAPPYDSKAIELWIHKQLKVRNQPALIADELLKRWSKGEITTAGKYSVGRFCILNGFFAPLLRALRSDLSSGIQVSWGLAAEILFTKSIKKSALRVNKDLVTALLAGATRDQQLHPTAAQALKSGNDDPRWPKIFSAEIRDRQSDAKKNRDKLFEELRIFKTEGMEPEVKDHLTKILSLFPEDKEARSIASGMGDKDVERTLDRIRKRHRERGEKIQKTTWPELGARLEKLKPRLDLDQAYHLSIALHQMGLNTEALEVLRSQNKSWTQREKLWELELLVAENHHAEALGQAQALINEYGGDAEALRTILYCSAKAYRGLEDWEQATGILRGILQHEPRYRDAAILLIEWENKIP